MSSLHVIWNRIVNELRLLQDKASQQGYLGHVINPVIGTVYYRETAFSAKVFAAEYRRTGDNCWLQRAERGLAALQEQEIYAGLSEPVWTPRGTQFKQGSIPATAMLLDAFWSAMEFLGKDIEREDWTKLLTFLKACYLGQGLFAHDQVAAKASHRPAAVQNTAAMALLLMEQAYFRGVRDRFVVDERKAVLARLYKGQRSDGFWPYIYPGALQNVVYRSFVLRPCLRTSVMRRRHPGDSSILFGDAVHHCLVLYCLTKSAALGQTNQGTQVILLGWKWLRKHIVDSGQGRLRFDFQWEPVPAAPRYCNFRDTTTYFMIIAIARMLENLSLLTSEEASQTVAGLSRHIESQLLSNEGDGPVCINPYEGPAEIIQNIFPRPSESVAWKGSLLSDVIIEA